MYVRIFVCAEYFRSIHCNRKKLLDFRHKVCASFLYLLLGHVCVCVCVGACVCVHSHTSCVHSHTLRFTTYSLTRYSTA